MLIFIYMKPLLFLENEMLKFQWHQQLTKNNSLT